jgi:hypothetical protein
VKIFYAAVLKFTASWNNLENTGPEFSTGKGLLELSAAKVYPTLLFLDTKKSGLNELDGLLGSNLVFAEICGANF